LPEACARLAREQQSPLQAHEDRRPRYGISYIVWMLREDRGDGSSENISTAALAIPGFPVVLIAMEPSGLQSVCASL